MTQRTNEPRTRIDPSKIDRPISLLALVGVLNEGIVGIIAYTAQTNPIFPILALALVLLPLLLIFVIFRLITHHHAKLYPPDQFPNSEDFMHTLRITTQHVATMGKTGNMNIFKPLGHDNPPAPLDGTGITPSIQRVEQLLESFTGDQFTVLHSWFNSAGRHDLALVCADIAIAKGAGTSLLHSFRSASLRKLGRVEEALVSAQYSLDLDPHNNDAQYNLARTLLQMGRISDVSPIVERLREHEAAQYLVRIEPLLKDACARK